MIDPLLADLAFDLAQQHIGEKAAGHADAAMDTPDRKLDALGHEGVMPGKHVIIDAVDERAIEIEQESRLRNGHDGSPRPVFAVLAASVNATSGRDASCRRARGEWR